jgi:hypothetical protein
MNFSNPRPGAVLVKDGEARLLRQAERFEDIVRLDDHFAPSRAASQPLPRAAGI